MSAGILAPPIGDEIASDFNPIEMAFAKLKAFLRVRTSF